MAELLQSTGGLDALRLKLALSIFWVGSHREDFTTSHPSAVWAELLDLADPDTRGARRVRDGIGFLDDLKLVEARSRPPRPSELVLRREDGSGLAYRPPDPTSDHPGRETDYYVTVPSELWTHGWLAALSGPALAALLLVRAARDFRRPDLPVWLSGDRISSRHGISSRTWRVGLQELEAYRLVSRDRTVEERGAGYASRVRLELDDARLIDEQVSREEWLAVNENRLTDD